MSTQDIVQKLWNLCNILRDDGITYHQYVTELTYILFLKMINETGTEEKLIDAVNNGSFINENLLRKLEELARRLRYCKGKKQYGYLPPSVKKMVDETIL